MQLFIFNIKNRKIQKYLMYWLSTINYYNCPMAALLIVSYAYRLGRTLTSKKCLINKYSINIYDYHEKKMYDMQFYNKEKNIPLFFPSNQILNH